MRKIIINTDPGQDDAVAILLALASPEEIEVLGIVAVAGNVSVKNTFSNARKVVALSGRETIRVFAGSDRPLRHSLVTAEHVHGVTGLDGSENLPDLKSPPETLSGVQFIIDTLRTVDDVTLVTLGPLTDIAKVFTEAPDTIARMREIVLMLGSWKEMGNVSPTAEFNAYVDPEAADIVLRSGAKLTLLPLDATHKVISTQARIGTLRDMGNRTGPQVAIMLKASEAFDITRFGSDGAPLHDPCTIAYLIRPQLFKGREVNVAIETQSELTRGMTVVDWWRSTDRKPNATFMYDADGAGFYDLLFERLKRLP